MKSRFSLLPLLLAGLLIASACAPTSQPSPTTAPAKPAATTGAKPASPPAAASPAAGSKPSPAAGAAASPMASPAAKPAASPAAAASFDEKAVADFYRGKTVRMIVGFAPGGGYDTYTRLIAKYIGKYIPGTPTVIVENLPGAGGATLTTQLFNQGPKDGTAIGNFPGDVFLRKLLGQKEGDYQAQGWGYLGAPSVSQYVCFVSKASGITSFQELVNGREGIFGSVPGTGDGITQIVKEATGANIRMVSGYAGTAPTRLALEQGEIDGMCFNGWESMMVTSREDLENGNWVVLAQMISQPRTDLPQGNSPTLYQFAKDDAAKALIKAGIEDPGVYARPYAVPPGVPKERLAALQQAFEKAMLDPGLKADADQAKLEIRPVKGSEIEKLIADFEKLPKPVLDRLRQFMVPGA